jgi:hypothetical protein
LFLAAAVAFIAAVALNAAVVSGAVVRLPKKHFGSYKKPEFA